MYLEQEKNLTYMTSWEEDIENQLSEETTDYAKT